MKITRFNILYIIGAFFLALFSQTPASAGNDNRFTLVIDAGHGGHDPGAIGRNVKEKNINLKVALKLGKLIEQNLPDVRVVYTRDRDVFIPLHRRAEIANNAKADLFVSIHTNSLASRNSRVSGAETYTLGLHRTQENLEVAQKENSVILIEDDYKQQYAGFNPNSAESYIIFEFLQDKYMAQSVNLAQLVQRQFRNNGRQDKGVHQAGFLVLRETSMPSILVELGYITNPTEAAFLISENGSAIMARSIYTAIANYRKQQQHVRSGENRGTAPATSTPVTETAPFAVRMKNFPSPTSAVGSGMISASSTFGSLGNPQDTAESYRIAGVVSNILRERFVPILRRPLYSISPCSFISVRYLCTEVLEIPVPAAMSRTVGDLLFSIKYSSINSRIASALS